MVTIKASYVVTPKEETPKGPFCLSECDQFCHRNHTLSVYIYNPKHNNNNNINFNELVQRMRESLSQILVHYYPLCGRLNSIQGGRLKLDCNAKGAMLFEAESTKSMAEFGDFSPNDGAIKELIPKLDYSQPIQDLPLFLAQVTKFQGGDGIAIGTALYHTISDGLASIQFINSWAKLNRGDTLDPNDLPFLDRTVFTASRLPALRRFDHPEFKPPPLILGRTDTSEEQKKKTRFALLKLTAEQVQKLKQDANIGYSESQQERPYSRFEAIGAHIWRCACIARELDKNQPTMARTVVDVRNKANPPLPKNYFENALGITVTPACLVGDMISEPLSYAAKWIREAMERVANDEYIRSQIETIARGEYRAGMIFVGSPNIAFISWMGMTVYEADFGWGKPDYFGPGAVSPADIGMMALTPHGMAPFSSSCIFRWLAWISSSSTSFGIFYEIMLWRQQWKV
ncbi:hypothetical protein PIB30_024730 [Stylosanthes scabra]|uniref:Spermidine hydroxycinnamoyl transferase n=1 Tax=Stylosanthes scabra TaxID=79078 RepID=A0ABU6SA23_9FABA|nr:hypothetical protein [Stylosanthes scabra]